MTGKRCGQDLLAGYNRIELSYRLQTKHTVTRGGSESDLLGQRLFVRIARIEKINKQVGVERKTSSAHASRRESSCGRQICDRTCVPFRAWSSMPPPVGASECERRPSSRMGGFRRRVPRAGIPKRAHRSPELRAPIAKSADLPP